METVVSPALSRGLSPEDLIKQNFFEGYEHCVIICFLYFVHGIHLSVRQLKRVLRCMNLHPSSHYHRTIRGLIQVSNPFLGPLCICYCFCIGYHVLAREGPFHPAILQFFHPSILPYFHTPSILIACHVLVASAHVKAIVGQQEPLPVGHCGPAGASPSRTLIIKYFILQNLSLCLLISAISLMICHHNYIIFYFLLNILSIFVTHRYIELLQKKH